MAKFKLWRKFLVAAIFSIALHSLAIFLFLHARPKPAASTKISPVKISIYTKSKNLGLASKQVGKQKRPQTGKDSGAQNKSATYSDYLPSAGVVSGAEGPQVVGGDSRIVYDGGKEFAGEVGNMPDVILVAREFMQHIEFPDELRKMFMSARGILRIKKQTDGHWAVHGLKGEPYLKALLFETYANISPDDIFWEMLDRLTYEELRLSFGFRVMPANDETVEEGMAYSHFGHRVEITRTFKVHSRKWQMLAVDPSTALPALNVFGIAREAYMTATDKDPSQTIGIVRLRLSPGYKSEDR